MAESPFSAEQALAYSRRKTVWATVDRALSNCCVAWGLQQPASPWLAIHVNGVPERLEEGMLLMLRRTHSGPEKVPGFLMESNWAGWWYDPRGPDNDMPHQVPMALSEQCLSLYPRLVVRNFIHHVINGNHMPALGLPSRSLKEEVVSCMPGPEPGEVPVPDPLAS